MRCTPALPGTATCPLLASTFRCTKSWCIDHWCMSAAGPAAQGLRSVRTALTHPQSRGCRPRPAIRLRTQAVAAMCAAEPSKPARACQLAAAARAACTRPVQAGCKSFAVVGCSLEAQGPFTPSVAQGCVQPLRTACRATHYMGRAPTIRTRASGSVCSVGYLAGACVSVCAGRSEGSTLAPAAGRTTCDGGPQVSASTAQLQEPAAADGAPAHSAAALARARLLCSAVQAP